MLAITVPLHRLRQNRNIAAGNYNRWAIEVTEHSLPSILITGLWLRAPSTTRTHFQRTFCQALQQCIHWLVPISPPTINIDHAVRDLLWHTKHRLLAIECDGHQQLTYGAGAATVDLAISSLSISAVAILKLYTTSSPTRTLQHLSRIHVSHLPQPLLQWLQQHASSAHFLLTHDHTPELDDLDTHPTHIPLGHIVVSRRWSHAETNMAGA